MFFVLVFSFVSFLHQQYISEGLFSLGCCAQMEVECALLEGEQESEVAQLQREKELLDQLKEKIHSSEKKSHTEKSQVKKKCFC